MCKYFLAQYLYLQKYKSNYFFKLLASDRYIESQRSLLENRKTTKEIVAHPVDAYVLLRKMTADWEDVEISLNAISNYSTGNKIL